MSWRYSTWDHDGFKWCVCVCACVRPCVLLSTLDSRFEGNCNIRIYVSAKSSSIKLKKMYDNCVFVSISTCMNECWDSAACQSSCILSRNEKHQIKKECNGCIASSFSPRSNHFPFLIFHSPARSFHLYSTDSSLHPLHLSLRLYLSIIIIACSSESPRIPHHPSLPLIHLHLSFMEWDNPFSFPRLSLFVSPFSPFSSAFCTLLSFLNPNAASLLKHCWIYQKDNTSG